MKPPFDHGTYDKLVDALGSQDLAAAFLDSFTSMLESRIRRIEQALITQDREEAITALLSLRSSASMVGAAQLEESTTKALAGERIESTPVGPLVRKLQGQADLFTRATLQLSRTDAAPQAVRGARKRA
ncbi:hypothetical protein FJV46_08460 [Arthrobacter agilis]|uniref:hypothetical protein n=1 Tax=Arthrobacter agilis TaxID=37921 RepID=UPI000B3625CF|nr:hypothetical protein [Arthrobacter agilis]OUM43158.1 hypothetical protein B8W74_07985 [Arthrobacter agilis]PPB46102.1 hypothetical protein CI784_10185 [Arthrobacter agilis]TPV25644.1 hypothetical protein FJV46_08460 [Arthrobacter agilis]VDR33420.1 Uncharacterised protein [Arthrobacter agilis]